MQLSRQPSEPLYLELAQVLRGELRHYRIGDFLPGEMQLARRFAVNRHTLRRAVDELINEGRLLRRQGKGTQVLQRPLVYPLQADSAYSESLAALGLRTEARLLERRQLSASAEEARHLQLAEGAALIELSTLRLLDGEPVSLIRHRYCASHAERLADYQGGSLRRYLGERGLPLTRRFSLIGARLADRDEAAQLLMPLRMPLLSVFTLSCDATGRPVEIALSASRSDRFQYQVAT
ncbi:MULTISPECIES: phosphonate metabolism transcriptional regulator PhnF [Stutzerimonas stutzeri subgroup]|jgi:GntR family phosphonate transport system transcriptional regulator|uniref:GntR family transcriptional regulator n=1 Tax=Stutzerimonas stutzeri NF13 TaxID=1212548 RepID=M2TL72_STUST|nr:MULTISPECIES: phosphonate metabolism transcriptional regulator PhnF [Stutzerimonas stutzeri subgroup]EMD98250.1 GntR family transcriptional regulator [Stutzerimonas stutzeri NF13]MBK3879342.1 phosphonate metabolism transcriptional regulator PhnF [Stutzerimonas stutzeri]MCQ4292164.1 phosphonate metabolism transcriptional regulator PhnF [Stutzerimonas stutzeri]WOF77250.1 phosphonate metabolism transcriptional regulator PhnF [Pseudomonas sp. FeN3W]